MNENRKNSTPVYYLDPKFGPDLPQIGPDNSIRQIFDLLSFWIFMALFRAKNPIFEPPGP